MNNTSTRADVVVVGAGPAGATAARFCASAGLRTVLVEKSALPRQKPCAGGITAAACRELGFNIPAHIIERQCTGLHIKFRSVEVVSHPQQPIITMVERSSFDHHLATVAVRAGANLMDHEQCIGLEHRGNRVEVKTDRRTVSTPVVIGADGYFSRVRKSFHPGFHRDEIRFCVLAEIPLHPSEILDRFKNMVTIHYGFVPGGYAWIFPKRNHVTVGAGGSLLHSTLLPRQFREYLSTNHLDSNTPLKGCFIPISRWRHDMYTNGVLLAGDAAGLVDSFNGEGIRFAIASGRIAAETAIAAHEESDFTASMLGIYENRCLEYMGRDLQKAIRATDLCFRHPDLYFGTVVKNSEALSQYVRTITGEMSLSDFAAWIKKKMAWYMIKRYLFGR